LPFKCNLQRYAMEDAPEFLDRGTFENYEVGLYTFIVADS
jgi:hypothetical protein